MHRKGWLDATMQRARHRARRALERARQRSDDVADSTSTVNITGRANIVVTRNIGEEGVARATSAKQTLPIQQSGAEPDEKGER
jgi:hypothetical protein